MAVNSLNLAFPLLVWRQEGHLVCKNMLHTPLHKFHRFIFGKPSLTYSNCEKRSSSSSGILRATVPLRNYSVT